MIVRVQTCWVGGSGGGEFKFRALVCGGLFVRSCDGVWSRKIASEMLDLIEVETGVSRDKIRFRHV